MITLNNSRQEELMNLLDTLEEYLKFGSTDGNPRRQQLRRSLDLMGSMLKTRLQNNNNNKAIDRFENEGGAI